MIELFEIVFFFLYITNLYYKRDLYFKRIFSILNDESIIFYT